MYLGMTIPELLAAGVLALMATIAGVLLLIFTEHADLGSTLVTGGTLTPLAYVTGSARAFKRGQNGGNP